MKNKKQKIRLFVFAAAFCLIVPAAALGIFFRRSGPSAEASAQYYDTMTCAGFASEDGIYHMSSAGFLYFFDYQTRQDVIVCNKPNCTHPIWYENTPDEQRCNAYLPNALGGAGFVLGDSLYLFHTNLNTQTASLIRSGLDRTGAGKIADFENNVILPFVVDGQSLYMSGNAILTEKDEDGMEHPTGENETWLFQVDLQTGETASLTERKKAYSGDLYIVGCYDGRIYYRESYFEAKYDGKNYEEAGQRTDWYSYDIRTGQTEQIYEEQSFQEAYLYGNQLAALLGRDREINVYEDGSAGGSYARTEITVWDLDTGKSRFAVTADELLDYADGKVFYAVEEGNVRRCYYYDMEQEKTVEMESGFLEHLHIRGAFGDYLLIVKDDPDTGAGDYFVTPKQDFYQEKEHDIPITWKEEP